MNGPRLGAQLATPKIALVELKRLEKRVSSANLIEVLSLCSLDGAESDLSTTPMVQSTETLHTILDRSHVDSVAVGGGCISSCETTSAMLHSHHDCWRWMIVRYHVQPNAICYTPTCEVAENR